MKPIDSNLPRFGAWRPQTKQRRLEDEAKTSRIPMNEINTPQKIKETMTTLERLIGQGENPLTRHEGVVEAFEEKFMGIVAEGKLDLLKTMFHAFAASTLYYPSEALAQALDIRLKAMGFNPVSPRKTEPVHPDADDFKDIEIEVDDATFNLDDDIELGPLEDDEDWVDLIVADDEVFRLDEGDDLLEVSDDPFGDDSSELEFFGEDESPRPQRRWWQFWK